MTTEQWLLVALICHGLAIVALGMWAWHLSRGLIEHVARLDKRIDLTSETVLELATNRIDVLGRRCRNLEAAVRMLDRRGELSEDERLERASQAPKL